MSNKIKNVYFFVMVKQHYFRTINYGLALKLNLVWFIKLDLILCSQVCECFRIRKTHPRAGRKWGSCGERRSRRATPSSIRQLNCHKPPVRRVCPWTGASHPPTASSPPMKRLKSTSWGRRTGRRHRPLCPLSLNTFPLRRPGPPRTNLAGSDELSI